ncbi:MAG TPA: hypothetical protein VI636_09405 [Candidatus Angelobacter sp.]
MAKSQFGVVGHHVARSYIGDVAIPAGVAVVAGASRSSVALPGSANQRALGVSALASANPNDPVTVIELGEVTAIADAAIARNQWVGINAITGQLAPINSNNLTGGEFEVVGLALEAATQQGDEFLLFVVPVRMLDNGSSPMFASLTLTGFLNESAGDGVVAHAGGGQGPATALVKELNRVATVATAGDSVVLPGSAAGLTIIVENHGANPMQVFGAGADTINDVAAATGVSQMQGSVVLYTCYTAGAWYAEGLGTGYSGQYPTVSSQDAIVAHAGGGQGSATALTSVINRITTVASAGDSVLLPAAQGGMQIAISNATATNSMNVFPNGADQINALGASAAFALAAGKTATFYAAKAGQWHAVLSA